MLEARCLFGDNGHVYIFSTRVSPIVEYGGAISKTSLSKCNQERLSNLRESRSSVADPDRKLSGGNLDEWGHFLYKFGFLNCFCLKYE
jgi:hypothetical protein